MHPFLKMWALPCNFMDTTWCILSAEVQCFAVFTAVWTVGKEQKLIISRDAALNTLA